MHSFELGMTEGGEYQLVAVTLKFAWKKTNRASCGFSRHRK
jgi:hypothetical protein